MIVTLYKDCILNKSKSEVFRRKTLLEEYLGNIQVKKSFTINPINILKSGLIKLYDTPLNRNLFLYNYMKIQDNEENPTVIVYAYIDRIYTENELFCFQYDTDVWHTYLGEWEMRLGYLTNTVYPNKYNVFDIDLPSVYINNGVMKYKNKISPDNNNRVYLIITVQLYDKVSASNNKGSNLISLVYTGQVNDYPWTNVDQPNNHNLILNNEEDTYAYTPNGYYMNSDLIGETNEKQNNNLFVIIRKLMLAMKNSYIEEAFYADKSLHTISGNRYNFNIISAYVVGRNFIDRAVANNSFVFKQDVLYYITPENEYSTENFGVGQQSIYRSIIFRPLAEECTIVKSVDNEPTRGKLTWGRDIYFNTVGVGFLNDKYSIPLNGKDVDFEIRIFNYQGVVSFKLYMNNTIYDITEDFTLKLTTESITADIYEQRKISEELGKVNASLGIIKGVGKVAVNIASAVVSGGSSVAAKTAVAGAEKLSKFNQPEASKLYELGDSLRDDNISFSSGVGTMNGLSDIISSIAQLKALNTARFKDFYANNCPQEGLFAQLHGFIIQYIDDDSLTNYNEIEDIIKTVGYEVNHIVKSIDNTITTYDVLKFSSVIITGLSTELNNEISSILMNGVRIWYSSEPIIT